MALVQKSFSEIITFSRASNATRFAPDGVLQYAPHNLLTYSEQFDNASGWTSTRASVSANATTAPTGTSVADKIVEDTTASNTHLTFSANVSVSTATVYTYSVYAKAAGRTWFNMQIGTGVGAYGANVPFCYFNLSGAGAVGASGFGTGSITDVGNGWYRCVVVATATTSASTTNMRIKLASANSTDSYTGDGTSGIFVWGAQLAVGPYPLDYTPTTTAVVYGPRFDYNPTTLAPLGLLIEEQRTNGVRNNTMVGAVAGTPGTQPNNWGGFAGTLAGMNFSIAAVGTETGIPYIDVRVQGTATGINRGAFDSNLFFAASSGEVFTSSAYFRLIAGSLADATLTAEVRYFNSSGTAVATTGQVFTPTNAALASQRSTVTATAVATTAFVYTSLRFGTVSGSTYDFTLRIGAPQLELGAFPTSVIPTATAAVTRSADVASINTLSPWYNAAEGTLVLRGIYRYIASGSPGFFRFDDGTDNERMMFAISNGTQRFTVIDGGTEVVDISRSGVVAETAFTHSAAYKVNDFAACVNGGVVGTDTVGTLPTVTQAIFRRSLSSDYPNGWLQRISYYNRRLTNAELQVLTS